MAASPGQVRTIAPNERELQRVEHLVLGRPRPEPVIPQKPKGVSRQEWKARKAQMRDAGRTLAPGIEEAVAMREFWKGIAGTPETLERASRTNQGSLARLCRDGTITANQLAAAEQIRQIAETIRASVALPIASWETRVDSGFRPELQFFEALGKVRGEMAYTRWRSAVDGPLSMLLDMIVGDEGYSVVAVRYRMGPQRAKRLLIDALDLWWKLRGEVNREVDPATLVAAHAGLL